MRKIYFLCTGNSCRSQMAEGFAKKYLGQMYDIRSAGVEQHGLNPKAVAVMAEVGIDISDHTSDLIDPEYFAQADLIVTLCGDARDRCPAIPPTATHAHWNVPDPAQAHGTENEVMTIFREVRDNIGQRLQTLAGGD